MDDTRPSDEAEATSALAAEAANFRKVLAAGRSAVFLQLFDFLVERSNDERAPKEVEIAVALFGDGATNDKAPDAGVRVYVHRLRKRLDDFYNGKSGPRLQIPKGEYRVVFSSGPRGPAAPIRLAWPLHPRWPGNWPLLVALAAAISIGSTWWFLSSRKEPEPQADELRQTALWRPMGIEAPPLVMVGDSYLLAETENQKDVSRLVFEPGIRSRSDLGAYLKTHPEAFFKLYDLDLHYTPIGTAVAAWEILPAVTELSSGAGAKPRLMSSSRVDLQTLESGDVVYVGRFSSLGILAAPLFEQSQFAAGRSYNELVDRPSGKHYLADLNSTKPGGPLLDYGYIASLPGPSGKHLVIISGFGDTSVQAMAALAVDPGQLDQLAKRTAPGASFEALYQVRAVGHVVLSKTLVVARPLHPANIWGHLPAVDVQPSPHEATSGSWPATGH